MRRKSGGLLDSELALLRAAAGLKGRGEAHFYGFSIAKSLKDQQGARRLVSHGTLYKALDRLEKAGMVSSRWEDPVLAAEQGRPRRRLYTLTAAGEVAATRPDGAAAAGKAAESFA